MSPPLVFTLENGLPLNTPLRQAICADSGVIEYRRFPDGESYLRILTAITGRHCILLANLCRPDDKFLPLLYLAQGLHFQGAASVGLVAPYLSYMRQDKAFLPGEVVTSRIFAETLSASVDWVVTVDPHLHRIHSLDEIYSIPTRALSGTPALKSWLDRQHHPLLLVGPDEESRQWVAALAEATNAPFIIGRKQRRGDREVRVELPKDSRIACNTAVIVDDVISSGHTVLQTLAALKMAGAPRVICASVHGIFAESADQKILRAGAELLVTSNSIPGKHCAIDLAPVIAPAIEELITPPAGTPQSARGQLP
ncbi:ribose-phosphate diphosphokinase [Microbulbifer sp. ALW1]|uniref:ribose-phosphate diphosphokinase n=1 Tax=Microbulbifer sp. (strain ALW1) TaxID=1516059 RepID=UPI00135CD798|nr:ribose-phosphate diphosphokinase [Microbulbifer sp. ALW1]